MDEIQQETRDKTSSPDSNGLVIEERTPVVREGPVPTVGEESDSVMRQRLVNSLSQSFPGSALSKALKLLDDENPDEDSASDMDPEKLANSCFSEIRLDKCAMNGDDDELTSLTWLQDTNILKNIPDNEEIIEKDDTDDVDGAAPAKIEPLKRIITATHVPYNPLKHVNSKPPYSFSCLIFMAIEDSPSKRLPVKDIYNWILSHFPYFQNAPTGWKNSIRHNLSLNKCFKKVEKGKNHSIGKGSLWCIDPDYRPNLLQALRKTPYHPYHQLQMLANSAGEQRITSPSQQIRINFNTPSPHLFPFLSRRLAQSKNETDCPLDVVDVASALVSLKGGSLSRSCDTASLSRLMEQSRPQARERCRSASPPEYGSEAYRRRKYKLPSGMFSAKNVVCTRSPSSDHTYSVPYKRRQRLQSVSSDSSHAQDLLSDVEGDVVSDSSDEESDWEAADIDSSVYDDLSTDRPSSTSVNNNNDEEEEDVLEYGTRRNGVKRHHKQDEALPVKKRSKSRVTADDDEVAKVHEGASALLNLAGIGNTNSVSNRRFMPITRSISPAINSHILPAKRQVTV